MNDEKEPGNESANAAPNTSETVEVPEQKPPGGWEMPKPVFQQSSGYLPKGFEKRFNVPDPQADVPTDEPIAEVPVAEDAPAAAPGPVVQPQPDVSEEFALDAQPAPASTKKKRSPAVRIFLTLLGIAAMIVFAIVFLAVIYYLFFYHPGDTQLF
jgi:hypothetical protein